MVPAQRTCRWTASQSRSAWMPRSQGCCAEAQAVRSLRQPPPPRCHIFIPPSHPNTLQSYTLLLVLHTCPSIGSCTSCVPCYVRLARGVGRWCGSCGGGCCVDCSRPCGGGNMAASLSTVSCPPPSQPCPQSHHADTLFYVWCLLHAQLCLMRLFGPSLVLCLLSDSFGWAPVCEGGSPGHEALEAALCRLERSVHSSVQLPGGL